MIDFIIQKAGGGTINLYSKNASTLSTVTNAEQSSALNSDDIVRITVESAVKIAFDIGDKMNILGRWYKINRLPTVKKTGNRLFTYNIELEGVQYDLARVVYDLTIDTTSNALQDVQADMLTGNLQRFATVLIANANRVFPGKWVLGDFPAGTEDKTLVFGETDNCLLVLQRLCSEYNTEFEIIQAGDVNTLHFRKAGQIYPYTFEYGKGKGLYSLERLNVSTANIVTRLKVFGGTRNITAKYRAARLCLPGKTKGQSYIQKTGPANNYGIWEATKIFEHIYPKRTGTVTAIDSGNVLKLTDSTMNFDLNEKEADGVTTKYLIDGSPAKIHFNTGNLSGYEFEIQSYDHATKTFTLKPFEDERGERFPSEKSSAFKFAVNDKYVLLDIALPQSYIDSAEEQLAEEGDIYYDQNSQPKVQYSLEVAEEFLKELSGAGSISNIFSVGDYIPVKDADIDVDKSVRVQSFTRDLLNPFSYKLNISDTVTTSITNRVISELIEIDKITKINDIKSQVKARRDWRSAQELLDMVFDTEGDYYSEKIKPNSIETSMLAVGAKSTQFGLVGTVIQANYNGNKNSVNVKGGTLSHYAIEESGRNWTLADGTTTLTGDSTPYYIYAKCQKVGTAGSIIFSTSKITVDEDPSFYHFLIGVVNSVDIELGVRSVALTYGFTTVNGKFIRTGRIQSNDGLTYFDLDLGEIGGKITFRSTGGTDEDLAEILDGVSSDIQDTQAAVNNLQVNNRNYIRSSRLDNLTGWSTTNGTRSIVTDPKFGNVVQWERTSGTPADWQKEFTLVEKSSFEGAPITLFVIAKKVSTSGIFYFGWNGDALFIDSTSSNTNQIDLGGGWFVFWRSSIGPASLTNSTYFGINAISGTWQFYAVGVNMANKYSGWQLADEDIKAEIDSAKQEALSAAGDAQSTADSLKNFTDTAFRDGIIDRSESVAIEKYKNSLNETMSKAEASYNKVYTNTYLEGTAKTSLLNAKVNLWGQRDTLLSAINTAISGGTTTPAQKTSVDNAFSTFNNLMTAFQNALEEANKAIQTKLDDLSTEKVNNIQIGGRNLFSVNDFVADNKARGYSTINVINYNGNIAYRSSSITNNHLIPRYLQGKFEANTRYYLQFKINWESYTDSGAQYVIRVVYTDGTTSNLAATTSQTYRAFLTTANKTIDYITTTRQYDGTVVIYEVQIEKANKPSDWTPAIEDVQSDINKAQADANLARAVTDKFGTDITGGLITTVMMLLREANSQINTAGFSGIQKDNNGIANQPSYWSGGTYEQAMTFVPFVKKLENEQSTSLEEYNNLPSIAFLHSGAAKVGHFIVLTSGEILIIDPATGSVKLKFTTADLPAIADLVSGTNSQGSTAVGAGVASISSSQVVSGSTVVSKNGAIATFNGTHISLSARGVVQAGGMASFAEAVLYARQNGVRVQRLASVVIQFTNTVYEDKSAEVLPVPFSFPLDAGTYTFELVIHTTGSVNSGNAVTSASNLSWKHTVAGVKKQQYSKDGMMFFYSNRHFYFSESEGLNVKESDSSKFNLPGVLLSATVLATGVFTSWWGAKKHASLTATKNSTGRYTVYHSIGHSNYQITATPTTANRSCHIVSRGNNNFVIEWRTIGSSPALSDTGFDFQITGNNY